MRQPGTNFRTWKLSPLGVSAVAGMVKIVHEDFEDHAPTLRNMFVRVIMKRFSADISVPDTRLLQLPATPVRLLSSWFRNISEAWGTGYVLRL